MADERQSDDDFARRIAAPLRADARGDASFTERVMSAVRVSSDEQVRLTRRPWLVRDRTLRFTPLGALALAAGFALAVLGLDRVISPASPVAVASAPDTVHVVRFVFSDAAAQGARSVMLVGSFNDWTKGALPLARHAESGAWSVSLPLTAGQHEYAFVIVDESGERWVADPAALAVRDEFGATTSVLSVGGATGST